MSRKESDRAPNVIKHAAPPATAASGVGRDGSI